MLLAHKVLVLDDSKLVVKVLERKLSQINGIEVVMAGSLAEARQAVAESPGGFFAAVVDLTLPDAKGGEAVALPVEKDIPAIILTASDDDALRSRLRVRVLVDHVRKEDPGSVDYVVSLVRRLYLNQGLMVLVVDDALEVRIMLRRLLETYRFQVLEAENGQVALEIVEKNPGITLVICDYLMPNMDGFELIARLRRKYSREEMAIIGISALEGEGLSSKFIKRGANDFLNTPFLREEFYCRINMNAEWVERMRELKEASRRDFLTGLHNRLYLHEVGAKLFENVQRGHLEMAVAMIDLDFFKKVNDTHGHEAGDEALKLLARILAGRFRASDIISRYGGEEFCILATGVARSEAEGIFENLRHSVEQAVLVYEGKKFPLTISIGVASHQEGTLENAIRRADDLLYDAKRQGRNRVVMG